METLTCFKCRKTQYEFQQCRQFENNVLVWLYQCPDPNCQHEIIARQAKFSRAPIVKALMPAQDDNTDIGGRIVTAPYDILAANPATDHEGNKVYWS